MWACTGVGEQEEGEGQERRLRILQNREVALTHTLELEDFLGDAARVRACNWEEMHCGLVDPQRMKQWD